MRVLIVEDEPPIAEYLKNLVSSLLSRRVQSVDTVHTMRNAETYLQTTPVDLCLLDLNLNGVNGYELLKNAVSRSFHTIIVSVHTDQALEAFEYGVLDFVPKPIKRERLKQALDRYFSIHGSSEHGAKHLVVRKHNANVLIPVEDIAFFEAERYLVKIHLKNGTQEYIEKPLNKLMQILPAAFLRVHRSYIVSRGEIVSYRHRKGAAYEILLRNQVLIPAKASAAKTIGQPAG